MKKLIAGILLVILLAGVVGCGGNTSETLSPPMTTTAVYSDGKAVPPVPVTQMPAPSINVGAPRATPAPTTIVPPTMGGVAYGDVSAADRMIIRNGNMQLVVMDVAAVMGQITNLATSYGGYVVNSNVQEDQNRLYGNISIRVLSERFTDTLTALRAMAVDVRSESTSGQDVTQEYTDLSANLRNLEAAEAQLLKLMEQAGKVTDILEVQKELVRTRGEIEQTKGRMQYLEKSSALAFIQISLEQSKLDAEFTATARNVKAGEKIYFMPSVSGGFTPYSYQWDLGDGQTSTEDRPSHAYRKAGTYTVSLKVTDDRGNTANLTRDKYITVLSSWEAGNTIRSAWNGFVGFMHFFVNLVIWLGIFSPVWIIILVILYLTVWRKRKKAAK